MKSRSCLCALSLTLALTSSSLARADADSDRQAAQALFEKSEELMKAKNYAAACPKLEEVTRLVPDGLGAKLTLAECYEGAGKLASAWTTYAQVESLAARLGQPERQTLARDRALALKPRLAHLIIRVPTEVSELAGLEVKRDGKPVGPAQFGEAIPADVGSHKIEVAATGKAPWSKDANVAAEGSEVTITVPALKDGTAAAQPGGGGQGGDTVPPPAEGEEPTWLLPFGIAVGSVGVAGLIVGGVMGGLAIGKQNDAEEKCPANRCSAEGNDARTGAGTFADVSTAMFIAGGVLAAAGIVVIIVAPKGDNTKGDSTAPSARLEIGPASFGFSGRF
jgi:hypothetical protein